MEIVSLFGENCGIAYVYVNLCGFSISRYSPVPVHVVSPSLQTIVQRPPTDRLMSNVVFSSHHTVIRSGFVNALNTTPGGTPNRRTIRRPGFHGFQPRERLS